MLCTSWWETPTSLKEKRTKKMKLQQHRVLSSFFLRMYVNACEEDGDRRPCTNVVNLFVNKCSPCLPLHPAHLDAKRRRRRRRKRSETFLPSSCLEAAPSKLTLTLPHHSLARSSLEDYSSNIYIPVCMCSMMMVLVWGDCVVGFSEAACRPISLILLTTLQETLQKPLFKLHCTFP